MNAARGFTHPEHEALCCITPEDLGHSYEDVILSTADGLVIRGWYIPSNNEAAVILLHPIGANRMATINFAAIFAEHGYGIMLIDIRAHGESDGDVLSYGGPEILDVVAAVDYLEARSKIDVEKIGVMGWSLGGNISLLSAAQDERIAAVIADAPAATVYEDWPKPETFNETLYVPFDLMFYFYLHNFDKVDEPISIKEAVSSIAPRSVLLIGSVSESGGNLDERFVNRYYAAAGEPKENGYWKTPGTSAGLKHTRRHMSKK